MKTLILWLLTGVLVTFQTEAQSGQEQAAASSPTTKEIGAARRGIIRVRGLAIGTNTPAFDAYAFSLMVKEAEHIRLAWQLKRLPPLTVSNVVWDAIPTANGVFGSLETTDGRFGWGFSNNSLDLFFDLENSPTAFETNRPEVIRAAEVRMGKIPSKITAQQAEDRARDYLHALGLTEKQLELVEPITVRQHSYQFAGGPEHLLPIFDVGWKLGPGFVISGITAEVAEYFNAQAPRAPLPTNYADMLELLPPTNLDQRLGLKPWPHK